MKAKLFIGAVAVFVACLVAWGWWQARERRLLREREVAAEQAEADRKAKAEADRRRAAQAAVAERSDEVRQNGPERLRLQRRYPEAYKALELRAGGDLSRCVVSARDEVRGENISREDPSLSARCGASLDQSF